MSSSASELLCIVTDTSLVKLQLCLTISWVTIFSLTNLYRDSSTAKVNRVDDILKFIEGMVCQICRQPLAGKPQASPLKQDSSCIYIVAVECTCFQDRVFNEVWIDKQCYFFVKVSHRFRACIHHVSYYSYNIYLHHI